MLGGSCMKALRYSSNRPHKGAECEMSHPDLATFIFPLLSPFSAIVRLPAERSRDIGLHLYRPNAPPVLLTVRSRPSSLPRLPRGFSYYYAQQTQRTPFGMQARLTERREDRPFARLPWHEDLVGRTQLSASKLPWPC